jgi:hypothetical protein
MSEDYHQHMLQFAKWQIYYSMSERGKQSVRDGSLDSSNGMMNLYPNTLANMITSVQNAKIRKSLTNGLILFRIL